MTKSLVRHLYEELEKGNTKRALYIVDLLGNNINKLYKGKSLLCWAKNFDNQEVIKKLEDNNIKIDTAHLNEDSFMDIAKITSKPIFCSHTAFYGVQPNDRNLKDYQLKMIIDSGGIVGLCLVSDFLNGTNKCDIQNIVSHIDYFACKFGINNLALGTDFYGTNHLPKGVSTYSNLISKLSNALKNIGYTEKSINKIFFENANYFMIS